MQLSIESIEILTKEGFSWILKVVPSFLLALVTLFIGLWIIKKIVKRFSSMLTHQRVEPTLSRFTVNIASIGLKTMLLLTVIGMLGVATTSFVAILGAAGLAIGLALQGNLANFAGGALILMFKPFKVGDYIVAQGAEGTVIDINVFFTALNTLDNKRIFAPNGPLSSGVLTNLSSNTNRRVDASVVLSNDIPAEFVQTMFLDMMGSNVLFLETPEPFVSVEKFSDLGVHYTLRVWTQNQNYWNAFFELHEDIKKTMEKNNITGAVPTRLIKNVESAPKRNFLGHN